MEPFIIEVENSTMGWVRSGNAGLYGTFLTIERAQTALDRPHARSQQNYRIVNTATGEVIQTIRPEERATTQTEGERMPEIVITPEMTAVPSVPAPVPASQQVITAPVSVKVSEIPKVKTTIRRNRTSGGINIDCTHTVPSCTLVIANLPQEFRKKVKKKSYWGLDEFIIHYPEIPLQEWANAISSAVLQTLSEQQGVTSELSRICQGGYLALDHTLYRLTAVSTLPQAQALAMTRKKLTEAAKAEAETIVESAKTAARALIQEGTRLKTEGAQIKRNAEIEFGKIPPRWLLESGYPITMRSNTWRIQLPINFCIYAFDVEWSTPTGKKSFTWEALPMEERTIRLWIPLREDKTVAATTIYVDSGDPELPHISHGGACMALNGAPKLLREKYDLDLLASALQTCHSRVQLNSCYTSITEWSKVFKEAIPEEIIKCIEAGRIDGNGGITAKLIEAAKKRDVLEVTPEQERRTTWTA